MSTIEPVVCFPVDPVGFLTVAENAVALESGNLCDMAVNFSQLAVGETGNDVVLGNVTVFGVV